MTTIYECEKCYKPCDVHESLLVRNALIASGDGCPPGFEPFQCLACATDEPPIRFVRKEPNDNAK